MPIKRRAATSRTARTRTKAPARVSFREPTPPLLSPDEKRQLILAHAETRQPFDHTQRVSMWVGLTMSIVFVVGLWAYGFGTTISRSFAIAPDPAV